MRPGGGKEKGSQFEREVCVELSRWVTNGEREDCFWRSAMSGGRATVRGQRGKNTNAQLGDISAITAEGHWLISRFVIEAKFYADLDIDAFLFKRAGKLAKFWEEVNRIAVKEKRNPLLIAKQNRLPPLLISTPEGIEELGLFSRVVIASCRAEPTAHICFLSTLKRVPCPGGY